ncbi:VanW family protein [Nakamurella flavida]|uniref:VanW family protein n=1 Tax=Nakamurella flavida TaxID=363630 RepID=A0A938YR98_9ACTN|nr:VanW family protein [Nakamurella flavida]MBM9477994.1 VanW family protein [Nakamurella flavida]MDP9778290.1 vancomycin resistance protein YoaR [Nakamurella flavida]
MSDDRVPGPIDHESPEPDRPAQGDGTVPVQDAAADPSVGQGEPDRSDEPGGTSARRRPGVVVAAVVGALVGVVALLYLINLGTTSGEIERNTSIGGVQVGGLTPEEARTQLADHLGGDTYGASVTLQTASGPVEFVPQDNGLTYDVAATVAAAPLRAADPVSWVRSFFTERTVDAQVGIDDAAFTGWLTSTAAATDVAAVEGDVRLDGTTVVQVDPVVGSAIDVPAAAAALEQAWRAGPQAFQAATLPLVQSPVRAGAQATQAAADQLRAAVSAPLVLDAGGTTVERTAADIAAVTTVTPDAADGFTVAVDTATLRAPVTPQVEATQTAPADASVAIVADAPVITPSTDGRTVDWNATQAAMSGAVLAADPAARAVPVVYVSAAPALSTAQVQALGINEVIGEFTTGGFASNSGENIRVVAEKVNGAIVQPGATFSLNDFTGQRTSAEGYVPAAVIQEGRISSAVGGGISQFSTTLYNAGYFAGMGDVTHTPHSFYISRYPPGREATVYDGEIDMAFSNDYPTGVLIQTIWTPDDITVRLWGTKHVEVESVTGDRFDTTPPERVVIPYGESCSASGGTNGFSIVDTRIIRDLNGAEIRRENFTTVYNGQQNIVCAPAPARATPSTTAAPTTAAEVPPAAAGG